MKEMNLWNNTDALDQVQITLACLEVNSLFKKGQKTLKKELFIYSIEICIFIIYAYVYVY